MNKNYMNQTTPQENKSKSQNGEEDIRDHNKTKTKQPHKGTPIIHHGNIKKASIQ